jgi:plasmid stability protein
MAKNHKRSVQQELRVILEKTVDQSSPDIFQKALDLRRKLRKKAVRFTDSAKLLREDRAR